MKTIWKGPTFQLVSVSIEELFREEKVDYHATVDASVAQIAILHSGLLSVEEADVLVFQAKTKGDETIWPKDGNAIRFLMSPLFRNKDGPVSLCGGGKECSEDGYELGLYRNLVREDPFPHLFYAPVPRAYPRLATLVAKA